MVSVKSNSVPKDSAKMSQGGGWREYSRLSLHATDSESMPSTIYGSQKRILTTEPGEIEEFIKEIKISDSL